MRCLTAPWEFPRYERVKTGGSVNPLLRTGARRLYCGCARAGGVRHQRKYHVVGQMGACTVNQQIFAAIKFGVSQNKVIWRLLNLASTVYAVYDRRHLRILAATNISEYTQFAKFAKYNSTSKFVDLQYTALGSLERWTKKRICILHEYCRDRET